MWVETGSQDEMHVVNSTPPAPEIRIKPGCQDYYWKCYYTCYSIYNNVTCKHGSSIITKTIQLSENITARHHPSAKYAKSPEFYSYRLFKVPTQPLRVGSLYIGNGLLQGVVEAETQTGSFKRKCNKYLSKKRQHEIFKPNLHLISRKVAEAKCSLLSQRRLTMIFFNGDLVELDLNY